jgi:hypothetical protein
VGEIPYYKEDKADYTHIYAKEITEVARIAVEELKKPNSIL